MYIYIYINIYIYIFIYIWFLHLSKMDSAYRRIETQQQLHMMVYRSILFPNIALRRSP